MADWGIKVSKSGKGVASTTPEDFIFSSKLAEGSLKTIQQGSGTLTINASTDATATISHPFSFVPLCMVFIENPANSNNYYFGSTRSGSHITNSNLYINIYNGTGSQVNIDYYYFMFGETAEYV
jgi:hypothetical protein